jgi:hypothetical protein
VEKRWYAGEVPFAIFVALVALVTVVALVAVVSVVFHMDMSKY